MVTIETTLRMLRKKAEVKQIQLEHRKARIRRGRIREIRNLVRQMRPVKSNNWTSSYEELQKLKRLTNLTRLEANDSITHGSHDYIIYNKLTVTVKKW